MPVEFHVLGSKFTTRSGWSAQGRYVNDDGVSLILDFNVNSYTLYATSNNDSIKILIGMD